MTTQTTKQPAAVAPAIAALRHAFWPLAALGLVCSLLVLLVIDLTPQVGSDFFFSTDDPALQASNAIAARFPAGEQLLIAASVEDPLAPAVLERLAAFSDALAATDGVDRVQSLTRGPGTPQSVPGSPLWGRLLLVADNPRVTNLVVTLATLDDDAAALEAATLDAATRRRIEAIEALVAAHSTPSFALEMSGVPYVVELVRRSLMRDLRTFSLAALVVFGLLIAVVYRSARVVAGTLAACLAACAITLATLAAIGVPIGVLTANIVTIVFVLTLSHIVFLTANARRVVADADLAGDADERAVASRAVAITLPASFWAMATTLLGFGSLLLASARPLRELAVSGAVGALVAIAVAFGLYPRFLRGLRPARAVTGDAPGGSRRLPAAAALLAAVVVVAAFGLPGIDTDPGLLAFFAEGSAVRAGIERIDRGGGSSPLLIVARDPQAPGGRLDGDAALAKMVAVQAAFDADPAVGVAISLPVLMAEARRVPLALLLDNQQLLTVLDSERFGRVARSFITADRSEALFVLRMREGDRREPRQAVIDRLRAAVEANGLEAALVGGIYQLQAALGALVATSLVTGLGSLMALFVVVAAIVARRARTAAAMVLSLAAVPFLLLGTAGHLRLPIDFISSPAANVAIALGIDGMIHLVSAVGRARRAGASLAAAWQAARGALWQPILGAMLILAGGFGIFVLSSFPPTRRFGLLVAFGTLAAALMALIMLPALAGAARRRGAP